MVQLQVLFTYIGYLACQYYQASLCQLLRPDYNNQTLRQYRIYRFEIPHKQNSSNESNEHLTGTAQTTVCGTSGEVQSGDLYCVWCHHRYLGEQVEIDELTCLSYLLNAYALNVFLYKN